jgi:tetratricopeptide (TPR) repeat protein
MKDYLQLDGMVYKLVPIKTSIPKDGNPMEMGQIDTDKMYTNIMKWDWGNSDGDIYHDPETRRESITYRTNLSRLTDQLTKEGKIEKAKKVINLAMEKMPIDKFGYYSLLEPFANAYYKVGEKEKAQELLEKLMTKYKENLNYYSKISPSDQASLAIDIVTDIERYRGLLLVMQDNADLAFYQKNKTVFNTYIEIFKRFGREKE